MTAIGRCPWPGCGGEGLISIQGRDCFVMCDKCDAAGPRFDRSDTGDHGDIAIAAWNRLAGPDVVIGRVRWVCGPGASPDWRLMMGGIEVGILMNVGAWHARSMGERGRRLGPFDDEPEASAALVDAVKRAMGGGE